MKYTTVLALAGAALVAAQDLSKLPECSKSCASDLLLNSGCGIDPKCICSNQTFLTDIAGCVKKGCTAESDLTATVEFAVQICKAVQIDIDTSLVLPATTSTSSSSSSSSTSSSTSTSTSAAASTTPTGSAGGKNNSISTPDPKEDDAKDSAGKAVRSSLIGVVAALAGAVLLL